MGLPTTREETAAPNAPVKSATINALQDAVIGGMHGEISLVLTAAAFQVLSGAAAFNSGRWEGGPVELFCGLQVPAGTRIVSLEAGYDRGGAGAISVALNVDNPLTNVYAGPFSFTIAAGTGHTTTTKTAADITGGGGNPILAADSAWSLQVTMNNAANVFAGIKLRIVKD